MQIDMHFYGVYALARLAGINPEAAKIIATASQYVDDSVGNDTLDHMSGGKLIPEVTAHHATSVRNLDRDHQRFIWIPFHFLPGNKGVKFTERLVCRKDSVLAKEMVAHHLALAHTPFALELMGITAHVYADTFAHYGFSGISSRRNKIESDKLEIIGVNAGTKNYLEDKGARFFRKYGTGGGWLKNIKRSIFSAGAEALSGALGHGAVLTYPDMPYLHWQYEYEEKLSDRPHKPVKRENRVDFLDACNALFGMFAEFVAQNPTYGNPREGGDIQAAEPDIKRILGTEAGKGERSEEWRKWVLTDDVFGNDEAPVYAPEEWNRKRDNFPALQNVEEAKAFYVYRFFQAASLHRHYVLRELLPKHDIIVV